MHQGRQPGDQAGHRALRREGDEPAGRHLDAVALNVFVYLVELINSGQALINNGGMVGGAFDPF